MTFKRVQTFDVLYITAKPKPITIEFTQSNSTTVAGIAVGWVTPKFIISPEDFMNDRRD